MLDRVLKAIPELTDAVVGADVHGEGSYDVKKTGAADATRKTARKTASTAKRAARQTRRAPGATRAQGAARGAVAREQDLPIARYGTLNADEITARLPELSQVELTLVDVYERRNDARTTILARIDALKADQPWTGYDSQNVDGIRRALGNADDATARAALDYERAHKQRAGVLAAAARETANA
jgi:hypothetical protein